ERFVAEGKVSNDVSLDRRLQHWPLKPRGISQVTPGDGAIRGDPEPNEHIAAESFDQGGAFGRSVVERSRFDTERAWRQLVENLKDDGDALLDLANSNPDARVYIAFVEHGDLEI